MVEKVLEQLNLKGSLSFVPYGNSMWPFIKNHKQSVIILKKEGRLKKYDIALYLRADNTLVLHRVIDVLSDGYNMCGDSLVSLEKVSEEQVKGVAVEYYKGRKIINCSDPKYLKKVDKWYKNKHREFKTKIFHFFKRAKGKENV